MPIVATLVLLSCVGVRPARGEVTQRHLDVAQTVFDRLIAVQEKPESWEIWPPTLTVADVDAVNAFASHTETAEGLVPTITINRGLIEIVAQFDPDVLAFTIGHEIGHLVHKHVAKHLDRLEQFGSVGAKTALVAVGREDELEADLHGMQLALKAGFSYAGIRKNLQAMMSPEVGSLYCAFEGLKVDHPAWEARAAYLQTDDVQRELWESMVAFRNGVLFLQNESYLHAEFCFRRVAEEFPECYEAWANLGYALLMQYCDALDHDDLRAFDIGHLAVGGFYHRPDSLATQIRGIDEDLWYEAVGAFREALRLKERLGLDDELLLVRANLGVAYLIHPAGKQVGEAEKQFSEVFAALDRTDNPPQLDPLVKAAIMINAGAGRGFQPGDVEQALAELQNAARQGAAESQVETLQAALSYTQARPLFSSADAKDQAAALKMLENYLATISPASSYWPLAYAQYSRLAQQQNKTPQPADKFRRPTIRDWRPVSSVELTDGTLIGLAEPAETTLEPLGEPAAIVPIITGTNLKRRHYPQHGISVLSSREILAIFLTSAEAPGIELARPGLGGKKETLRVGMSRSELQSLLGGEWDIQFASIDDPETVYHLYRDVGIAARYDGDKVCELVVVVAPRQS